MEKIARVQINDGKIGGKTDFVKITGVQVGASGAAYGDGDLIGDQSPIEAELIKGNYGTAVLQSIIIKDLSGQSSDIDVVFFDSDPIATTFTDNAAFDLADADAARVLGVVSVLSTDYSVMNDNSIATKLTGLVLKNASGENKIWFCLVSRGTPTYVADELSIAFGVLQD